MIKNLRDLPPYVPLAFMALGALLACFGSWPGVGAFAVGSMVWAWDRWLARDVGWPAELAKLRSEIEATDRATKERLARVSNKVGIIT